jgi:hypothetical protein
MEANRFNIGARAEGRGEVAGDKAGAALAGGAEIALHSEILDKVWAEGFMTVEGAYGQGTLGLPRGEGASQDGVYSGGNFGGGVSASLSVQSSIFAGGPELWMQAGMGHASFGPFFNNGLVIGPQAPETPNFGLHAQFGGWRFSMGLFLLEKGGTQNGVSIPGAIGKDVFFHSFSYSPAAGWDLGIFESIIVANRFEPMYLLPLADYFLLQNRAGYGADGALGDNSLAGVYVKARLANGLSAKALVYIDDLQFDDIIRLHWDTKWMLSAQGGFEWAPETGPVRLLSADYSVVLPYMYTHYYSVGSDTANNYQNNYTTSGENFGPALLPNSDRVEINAFAPLGNGLELTGVARLIRHGNASAGVTGLDPAKHDGGLGDDGWSNGSPSYQPPYVTGTTPMYLRFLAQDVLEYSWQAGLGASVEGKIGKANLSLSARYLFEYRVNEDLVSGANVAHHYLSLSTTLLF